MKLIFEARTMFDATKDNQVQTADLFVGGALILVRWGTASDFGDKRLFDKS